MTTIENYKRQIKELRDSFDQYGEEMNQQLATAQKEIEKWKTKFEQEQKDCFKECNITPLTKQVLAAQAQIVKYREALEAMVSYAMAEGKGLRIADEALAQPTNTEALDEAIRKVKIEVLRDVCEKALVFANDWTECSAIPKEEVEEMIAELEGK